MIEVVTDAIPGALTLALESLDGASRDLDDAVLALPGLRGDDVMASSTLVGLLFRVVAAKRAGEALTVKPRSEPRPSTVS